LILAGKHRSTAPSRLKQIGSRATIASAMTTFFYSIWLGSALLYLLMALWAKLEQISNKQKHQNPGDFYSQGIFLAVCAALTIAIDHFFLQSLVANMAPEWLPLWFFRLLLFPAVIYLAAITFGPSKKILISRAPQVSNKRKR
jgi:hypothetical protein